MKKNIRKILRSETLRKKIYVTIGLVVAYKFLSVIPIPGVSAESLVALKQSLASQDGLLFFSSLMGGGLERFSIILMGLSPYINASIIMQLLGVVIPKIEEMKKEGQSGQRKITQITRILTVPLAFGQSYGMILLLNQLTGVELIDTGDFFGAILPAMVIVTGGTILLMWLGELVNEIGIGNGISMVIFAGVLAGVPTTIISQLSNVTWSDPINQILLALVPFLILLVGTLAIIYVIIKFTEGYRRIPLIYTRTGRDERSYFPIRVNQAGMIPIIFAISIVTFPYIMGQVLLNNSSDIMIQVGEFLTAAFNPNNAGWLFIILYFLFVLGFAYFYVSITFDTDDVAENIQKRGGYIPNVRPGAETAAYLRKTSNHLNLFGGGFLALIAVFPYLANKLNALIGDAGIPNLPIANIDFLISGAGIIIVVGVILELIRRVDAEMKSYDYKRFY